MNRQTIRIECNYEYPASWSVVRLSAINEDRKQRGLQRGDGSHNAGFTPRFCSEYIKTMRTTKGLPEEVVRKAIESHKINPDLLMADDFDNYFILMKNQKVG